MKKTAKTAAIALALTAAAAGLTSCSPPDGGAYGVYGPDPNSTLTTVSSSAPEAVSTTESAPDKAPQDSGTDGADSPEKDGKNSAGDKKTDSAKGKADGKNSADNKKSDSAKDKADGAESADSKKSESAKDKADGANSAGGEKSDSDKENTESAGSAVTETQQPAEDKPPEVTEPAPMSEGIEVDEAADEDGDTFAEEDGIEEDDYEIATETEDIE